ncbi:MAG TPA: DoxX family protein [Pseudonocardiaceae bacterium]
MSVATTIVLAVTAAANIGIAVADLARARFVLANSAEVEVPESWLPGLAALKGAGGIGLLLWFVGLPVLPTIAAAGLVCFFVGAITAHIRARVLYNIAFPGAYLALAAASLIVLLLGTPA